MCVTPPLRHCTYPKVLAIEEHLRDLLPRQALVQLLHVVFAHVHVSFFEMHTQANKDLLELRALDFGHEHRAHRRVVEHEHATKFRTVLCFNLQVVAHKTHVVLHTSNPA